MRCCGFYLLFITLKNALIYIMYEKEEPDKGSSQKVEVKGSVIGVKNCGFCWRPSPQYLPTGWENIDDSNFLYFFKQGIIFELDRSLRAKPNHFKTASALIWQTEKTWSFTVRWFIPLFESYVFFWESKVFPRWTKSTWHFELLCFLSFRKEDEEHIISKILNILFPRKVRVDKETSRFRG